MSGAAQKGSALPPLLVLALGAATLAASRGIRPGMLPNDPGPAFLPSSVGAGLIALAVYLLINRAPHEGMARGRGLVRVIATVALTAGYLLAIEPLGFPAATTLFLVAQMWIVGLRHPMRLALLSLALAGGIYLTFRMGLDVALPASRFAGIRF